MSVNDWTRWVVTGGSPSNVSFTKEVKPQLAKRPLKSNGRLAYRGLTS